MTVDPLLSVDALLVWCSRLGNGRTCAAASERPARALAPPALLVHICGAAGKALQVCRARPAGQLGRAHVTVLCSGATVMRSRTEMRLPVSS